MLNLQARIGFDKGIPRQGRIVLHVDQEFERPQTLIAGVLRQLQSGGGQLGSQGRR